MIVEFTTSEGVIHKELVDPQSGYFVPRKNETVKFAGVEYDVRSVSYELDNEQRFMGRPFKALKVTVELV